MTNPGWHETCETCNTSPRGVYPISDGGEPHLMRVARTFDGVPSLSTLWAEGLLDDVLADPYAERR